MCLRVCVLIFSFFLFAFLSYSLFWMLCFAVVEVASDKGMPQVVARWGRDPVACSAYGEEGFALARKSGRVSTIVRVRI